MFNPPNGRIGQTRIDNENQTITMQIIFDDGQQWEIVMGWTWETPASGTKLMPVFYLKHITGQE